MKLLRDPASVQSVQDPAMRELLTRRFAEVADGQAYDPDVFGYFVLAQTGDSAQDIETLTRLTLLAKPAEKAQLGDAGFLPGLQCITEHSFCYEMVFVLDDSGYGIVIVLPKHGGSDPELLALCRLFATS